MIDELHADGNLTDEEVEELKTKDIIEIGGINIDFSLLNADGKTYTITYELGSGVNNSNNPSSYISSDSMIILENPTKERM